MRSLAGPVLGVLLSGLLAGCDFDGAYDLPLPGSIVKAEDGFVVTAEFADVLNVVPRSPVMVDDVVVGEVTEVDRDGWSARVWLRVRKDVDLPDNVIAEIRQTSLLGEKYVALDDPPDEPRGTLEDGDVIGISQTGRNPEVEEVLGALSFLLSGGGVEQLRSISVELNDIMGGRTDRIRSLMRNLDDFVGTLDRQKADIISAMESLNNLSRTLVAERETIGSALDATGPALAVLNRQHQTLRTMLVELDRLGRVGSRVIGSTKEDLLATLRHLKPILSKLNESGESLPRGLSLLISFPFPQEASETVKGDYANAAFALDVDLTAYLRGLGEGAGPGGVPLPDITIPGLPRTPVGSGGGLLERGLG